MSRPFRLVAYLPNGGKPDSELMIGGFSNGSELENALLHVFIYHHNSRSDIAHAEITIFKNGVTVFEKDAATWDKRDSLSADAQAILFDELEIEEADDRAEIDGIVKHAKQRMQDLQEKLREAERQRLLQAVEKGNARAKEYRRQEWLRLNAEFGAKPHVVPEPTDAP